MNLTSPLDAESGQIHKPVTLSMGKRLLVPTEQETIRFSETMITVTVEEMNVLLAETCDVKETSIAKSLAFLYFNLDTFCCGNLKGRDHMKHLGVHGILLKHISKKNDDIVLIGVIWLIIGTVRVLLLVRTLLSGSIKSGKFLN
jgi:hypothetical protein